MQPKDLELSQDAVRLARSLIPDGLSREMVTEGLIDMSGIPRNRTGDEIFAYRLFQRIHGRAPTNQMLFNDVLYRIKTTDEILDPLRVFVSDKEFVKVFVKAIVGDQYNVPTINVLKSPREVDTFDFPSDCCIKPTHCSGAVILRKNNETIDKKAIEKWFTINYYHSSREANYKNLKPKVIVEPLIFGNTNIEDYKFFCFNGKVKLIQLDLDRRENHKRAFFDRNWTLLNFTLAHPKTEKKIPVPQNLSELVAVAERIAHHFSFIRVDLYSDGQQCLVGEITNCHGNAGEKFIPRLAEEEASRIIFSP